MKKQIVLIHGGDTFSNYEEYLSDLKATKVDVDRLKFRGWKDTLAEKIGREIEVLYLKMPNKENAKYLEWKIWFEKYIPFFENEAIFIGHSLGGIFLAKYLSENEYPKKIKAVLLVAAPFNEDDLNGSLADFNLPKNLTLMEEQAGKIYLYHSKDDPIVPFSHLAKYQNALPSATATVFEDRNHFLQEEFPELVKELLLL